MGYRWALRGGCIALLLAGCGQHGAPSGTSESIRDDDWPGYGRTAAEDHYSPLAQIDEDNVGELGLVWSMDLPPGNAATIPVEVGGVLYAATGLSIVRAIDAATGKQLWTYDPQVGEQAGFKLRMAWGIRGLAWWDGKIYVGTQDGRLIAIDAKTGEPIWSVMTVNKGDRRFITGAPRLFDGKVIIGHGGADGGNTRGYVTTYDARTGRQLWRFYTVPGNPADGFEDETQATAAKTWTGQWWKFGGGGTAWNAFTYDAETGTILVGTGNGAPWNQKIRSPGGGDNLFLCSMVALDAKTGKYKWHYQFNPGETWDYNAAMDMHLADLSIDGERRKVVMTAPKNGFLYVLDRTNGKLISAEKYTKVTWATHIDLKSGRPAEVAGARYPEGKSFEMWPSYTGSHSWMPSAFDPQSGLLFIPAITSGARYDDKGIQLGNWKLGEGVSPRLGVNADAALPQKEQNSSALVALNPVTQKQAWRVPTVGGWNGGILASGGNLVFQGQLNGRFSAYGATSGRELWHFDAQAGILSAPISYRVGGKQYVTVVVGIGTSVSYDTRALGSVTADYREQPRRILTFALGGTQKLPVAKRFILKALADPTYKADPALAAKGADLYNRNCVLCHGVNMVAGGVAPDLRASSAPQSRETFAAIVHQGAFVANGMPRFSELGPDDLNALRQYARARAGQLRDGRP